MEHLCNVSNILTTQFEIVSYIVTLFSWDTINEDVFIFICKLSPWLPRSKSYPHLYTFTGVKLQPAPLFICFVL